MIRKAMLGLAWLGLCALVFEISLRGLAAVEIGRSAWLYGWSPDRDQRSVSAHENGGQGYSKYFPGQKRTDRDAVTGESFEVTINRDGFRGGDFPAQKAAGVVTRGLLDVRLSRPRR